MKLRNFQNYLEQIIFFVDKRRTNCILDKKKVKQTLDKKKAKQTLDNHCETFLPYSVPASIVG